MKFATFASFAALTPLAIGVLVPVTVDVTVEEGKTMTATVCPSSSTSVTAPISIEDNDDDDDEIIYVTIFTTTTTYETHVTIVTECSDYKCSQVTSSMTVSDTTLATVPKSSSVISTAVENITLGSSSSFVLDEEDDYGITYVTLYQTTTTYEAHVTVVTKCSDDECSQVSSMMIMSDAILKTFLPSSSGDCVWTEILSLEASSSSTIEEGDDRDITYATVYSKTSTFETRISVLAQCSDNKCSELTIATTLSSPISSAIETPSDYSSDSSSIETDCETNPPIIALSDSTDTTYISLSTTSIESYSIDSELTSSDYITEEELTSSEFSSTEISSPSLELFAESSLRSIELKITSEENLSTFEITSSKIPKETDTTTVFSYSLEGPSSVQTDSPSNTFFESSSLPFESTSLKASFSEASIEIGSSSAGIEVKIQTTSESSTAEESSVNVFSKTSSLVSTLLSSNEFSSLNYLSSIPPPLSTTTNIETTIITTTSCSGDICSKVTHTNDLTTVTEDATVYTTYSTLFTSVESASGEELFILSQSDDISFSTSLSPPEPNTEYSGSMPAPPYSVIKSNAFPVEVLRTMTCSSEECLTSLAAIPSSEVESSMENQTEEQVTLSSTESQEVIPTTTAESIPPIESLGATTSVAVPSTLSAVDHSSELIEGVTDSSKEVTTDKPESHVTTIVSYNSEKDVITKITSTIETTSRVQRSSIKSDVEVPQATTESSPEEVSEEGTLATGTTLLDSTSLVYNAQETFAVSSNLESPAVSTYEGSALVNTPELAVVCGMLFYFI